MTKLEIYGPHVTSLPMFAQQSLCGRENKKNSIIIHQRMSSSHSPLNNVEVISVTPCVSDLIKASGQAPTQLHFSCTGGLQQDEVKWTALLFKGHLYLSVPNGLVVETSKEAFVTLLEFAEEQLDCEAIVVCFAKNRPEKRKY